MNKILFLILSVFSVFPLLAQAEGLPEADKTTYIRNFLPSCLVAQRTDSFSKYLSEEQREEYCECSASRSAETVTLEELGTMIKTQNKEILRPHLTAVASYCGDKLMPKWLPK